ncbi:MAG: hypothetical protein JW841_09820 [Deltaproteobacteria bacterium]|nr:hypothetical protein [Deltaproteobacteria bacterium]
MNAKTFDITSTDTLTHLPEDIRAQLVKILEHRQIEVSKEEAGQILYYRDTNILKSY